MGPPLGSMAGILNVRIKFSRLDFPEPRPIISRRSRRRLALVASPLLINLPRCARPSNRNIRAAPQICANGRPRHKTAS